MSDDAHPAGLFAAADFNRHFSRDIDTAKWLRAQGVGARAGCRSASVG